ncbi:MAG: DUF459 domain-containing protein [Acidimicrobiales bacterium]|nr:DUF459 domain-containing protein [Acidimicrobiales bacterium]
MRVLVIGDDLAAATGPVLAERLEATGRAQVHVEARPGTGLASSVDWPARLAPTVDAVDPDVVVAQFGGTDSPPYATGIDGLPAPPGSPGWFDRWGRATRAITDVLAERGVLTYWVTTPPVADPAGDERAQAVDLAVQSLAARQPRDVRTIDVRAAVAGPDGGFAATGTNADGRPIALRAADGYGLGADGAGLVADVVAARLTADWCLDPAVPTCTPHVGDPAGDPWVGGPPAAADPVHVLVVGDSILWQAAPRIRALLLGTGRATAALDARPATGLLGDVDWPSHLQSLVDTLDPDVTVVQFMGQNSRPDLTGPDGSLLDPTTSAYVAAFVDEAARVVDVLTSRGGRVAWVLGPPLGVPAVDATLRGIGLGVLGLPATVDGRLVPVDLYRALGTADGAFTQEVPDGFGGQEAIRLYDGVHLTGAGAARNARAVVAALDRAGCLRSGTACREGAG